MHKVRKVTKSRAHHPMKGSIHVDEFVIGGKETGKVGCGYYSTKKRVETALELKDTRKIKRRYAVKIDNFLSKELEKLFDIHIAEQPLLQLMYRKAVFLYPKIIIYLKL